MARKYVNTIEYIHLVTKTIIESYPNSESVRYVFHRGSKVNGRQWILIIYRVFKAYDPYVNVQTVHPVSERHLITFRCATSTELLDQLYVVQSYIYGKQYDERNPVSAITV